MVGSLLLLLRLLNASPCLAVDVPVLAVFHSLSHSASSQFYPTPLLGGLIVNSNTTTAAIVTVTVTVAAAVRESPFSIYSLDSIFLNQSREPYRQWQQRLRRHKEGSFFCSALRHSTK